SNLRPIRRKAKGRVERANGTLQDRLVKALRPVAIATITEAMWYFKGSRISGIALAVGWHQGPQQGCVTSNAGCLNSNFDLVLYSKEA
ncbi:MAG: hypothetical protein AB7L36_16675, partial [Sphingomonadaceae bacterium]